MGQPAVTISAFAAFTLALTASAVCACYAARGYTDLSDPLRWLGLGFVWSYVFYWLNSILLLREAFAA